eukprot:2164921-Amphidinium_carterae.1
MLKLVSRRQGPYIWTARDVRSWDGSVADKLQERVAQVLLGLIDLSTYPGKLTVSELKLSLKGLVAGLSTSWMLLPCGEAVKVTQGA